MHTCPPPTDAINDWLTAYPTVVGHYGHLLLEQREPLAPTLARALRPYFESAHLDAREHFGAQIGIDLHPDADDEDGGEAYLLYPRCLPVTARRGLFGEVMAGLVTELFDFVGHYQWKVPIFLFRYHADVEKYLFDLARDAARQRMVFGRFGSDFLGLCLDAEGNVIRFIAGEAKWRETLTDAAVETLMHGPWVTNPETGERRRSGKGVWFEVNRGLAVPHGVRQLQRLLQERDPDGHAATILSLDRALVLRNPVTIPRTNLILLTGNGADNRDNAVALLPFEQVPEDYSAPHDLQVVEVILQDGEVLIDQIYDALWVED
jgi:hypothetical protein